MSNRSSTSASSICLRRYTLFPLRFLRRLAISDGVVPPQLTRRILAKTVSWFSVHRLGPAFAFAEQFVEGLAGFGVARLITAVVLPPSDRVIDVCWFNFDSKAAPAGAFGGEQRATDRQQTLRAGVPYT